MGPNHGITDQKNGNKSEDGYGDDGKADLPEVVLADREPFLDLFAGKPVAENYIAQEESNTGDDEIPTPDQLGYFEILLPIHS